MAEKSSVYFADASGTLRAFIVKNVDTETGPGGSVKRVFCEDAAVDELMCHVIEPTTNTDDTATEILTTVLGSSRWGVGTVESFDDRATKAWSDSNLRGRASSGSPRPSGSRS